MKGKCVIHKVLETNSYDPLISLARKTFWIPFHDFWFSVACRSDSKVITPAAALQAVDDVVRTLLRTHRLDADKPPMFSWVDGPGKDLAATGIPIIWFEY